MRPILYNLRYLLVFMACLSTGPHLYAAASRTIANGQWQQIVNDKAFSYKNEREGALIEPAGNHTMARVISEILTFIFSTAGIIIVIAIAVILVIVIVRSVMAGRRKTIKGEVTPEWEDLTETNWEAALKAALATGDNRQAVRASYMLLLEMLQRRNLIEYRHDKTNNEYAAELGNTDYRQPFRQMTRQYEYTWYGRYILQPAMYDEYMATFNTIKNRLQH